MAKFMVIYLGVGDGKIKGVYKANNLPPKKEGKPYYLPPADSVDKPLSVNAIAFDSIPHIYGTSSPGCRYVYKNGIPVRVCNPEP